MSFSGQVEASLAVAGMVVVDFIGNLDRCKDS